MSVQFNYVLDSQRRSGIVSEYNTKNARSSSSVSPIEVIAPAQYLTSGATAVSGEIYDIKSESDAYTIFGYGSMGHVMARAAFAANPQIKLKLCAVPDNGTTKAANTSVFSATSSTSAGVARCWVGNEFLDVSYGSGTASTALTTAITAAFATDAGKKFPAVVSGGGAVTTTFTAKNAGTNGNRITYKIEMLVPDTGITVTNTGGYLALGSVDPDFTTYFTKMQAVKTAKILAFPVTEAYDGSNMVTPPKIKTHLGVMSSPDIKIRQICVIGWTDSVQNLKLLQAVMEHERIIIAGTKVSRYSFQEITIAAAAQLARYSDPSLPVNYMSEKAPIGGFPVVSFANDFTNGDGGEIEDCLQEGVTPIVAIAGNNMAIHTLVSTKSTGYSQTVKGQVYVRNLDELNEIFYNLYEANLADAKANNETVKSLKSLIKAKLYELEASPYERIMNVDSYIDQLVVEINASNKSRIDCMIPVETVFGLNIIATSFETR